MPIPQFPLHPAPVWRVGAALMLAPWAAQACMDGAIDAEAEGGRVFTAANVGAPSGGLVPFSGGFNLSCTGDEKAVPAFAAGANGSTVQVGLAGKASGGLGQVHSQASSSASGTLLGRNTTPAIFADSAAVLKFNLVDVSGEPVGATVRFDIVGDGHYIGSGQAGGYAGFSSTVRSGAAGVVNNSGWYRDSNGVSLPNTPLNFFAIQSIPTNVQFGIDYTANFYGGGNWLQLDLYTFAWGSSSADFSHTASIAGLTVLTPGVKAELPPGWFVEDPAQAGHYLLAALQPVPEPQTWALLVVGLVTVSWRRRAGRHLSIAQA